MYIIIIRILIIHIVIILIGYCFVVKRPDPYPQTMRFLGCSIWNRASRSKRERPRMVPVENSLESAWSWRYSSVSAASSLADGRPRRPKARGVSFLGLRHLTVKLVEMAQTTQRNTPHAAGRPGRPSASDEAALTGDDERQDEHALCNGRSSRLIHTIPLRTIASRAKLVNTPLHSFCARRFGGGSFCARRFWCLVLRDTTAVPTTLKYG